MPRNRTVDDAEAADNEAVEDDADLDAVDDDAHLDGVDDGCGCTEIWEHLSDQRDD